MEGMNSSAAYGFGIDHKMVYAYGDAFLAVPNLRYTAAEAILVCSDHHVRQERQPASVMISLYRQSWRSEHLVGQRTG